MKIALISDTHVGPPTDFISNDNSESFLEQFLHVLAPSAEPDLLVHLGDHIQHHNRRSDLESFTRIVGHFRGLATPSLLTIGNHDQVNLSEEDLARALKRDAPYHSRDVAGYHFIVLFTKTTQPGSLVPAYIPEAQLRWLERDLAATELPTVVFSHYPLINHNVRGNFWFETAPHCAVVENSLEVLDILARSGKVRAAVSGHLHSNEHIVARGIPFFSVQAVVEINNVPSKGQPALSWALLSLSEGGVELDVRGNDSTVLSTSQASREPLSD